MLNTHRHKMIPLTGMPRIRFHCYTNTKPITMNWSFVASSNKFEIYPAPHGSSFCHLCVITDNCLQYNSELY